MKNDPAAREQRKLLPGIFCPCMDQYLFERAVFLAVVFYVGLLFGCFWDKIEKTKKGAWLWKPQGQPLKIWS